jgi:hypothetical protein
VPHDPPVLDQLRQCAVAAAQRQFDPPQQLRVGCQSYSRATLTQCLTAQERSDRPISRLAASIVTDATSEEPEPDPYEGKKPAAIELGRQGGRKGGRARAEKLTPEQRSEIARKPAAARWAARDGTGSSD